MTPPAKQNSGKSSLYYIGWDVGGWSCDKNKNSRDAIVILDASSQIVGKPKRTSIKRIINDSENAHGFIANLFKLCDTQVPSNAEVILAIDTPLGYSTEFINLISGKKSHNTIEAHTENRYLFRATERFLFKKGFKPLSAVQDMLGSQSTKGIHVLRKFKINLEKCGVWKTDRLTVIETYPSANKGRFSDKVQELIQGKHHDIQDAFICAKVAEIFDKEPEKLYSPKEHVAEISEEEGWIWVIKQNSKNKYKW